MTEANDTGTGASPDDDRSFEAQGRSWTARVAGDGLGGTGRQGVARLSLVHFIARGETAPRFGTLIASGTFEYLHERELADLLARAQPLPPPVADPPGGPLQKL
jgi:hypothetical protein